MNWSKQISRAENPSSPRRNRSNKNNPSPRKKLNRNLKLNRNNKNLSPRKNLNKNLKLNKNNPNRQRHRAFKRSRTIAGSAATVNRKIVSATTAAKIVSVIATASPPTQKRPRKLKRRLKLKTIKIVRRVRHAKKIVPRPNLLAKSKSRVRRTSKLERALPLKIWQAR